jgi:hypothetical protein
MVDDTEARVRAALQAYADLVEDDSRELPARPAADVPVPAARVPVRARWRAPALVAAAVVAVVSGSVWLVAGRGEDAPVAASAPVSSGPEEDAPGPAAESAAPFESAAEAPATAGQELTVPTPARVGVAYPFDLYTHCGVLGADVAGTWFAAGPPLVEGTPPAGWGNPYQRGTLTLLTSSEALFQDEAGHEVRLSAAPESQRPAPCD